MQGTGHTLFAQLVLCVCWKWDFGDARLSLLPLGPRGTLLNLLLSPYNLPPWGYSNEWMRRFRLG